MLAKSISKKLLFTKKGSTIATYHLLPLKLQQFDIDSKVKVLNKTSICINKPKF